MLWYYLGETLWVTFFWWVYIFPLVFKIIAFPIKLSILNISTWFRGWRNVATELAQAGVAKGIARGKYPPNPPQAVWTNEMWKAHAKLVGGAIVNFYIVVFMSYWFLNLLYS